MNFLKRPGFWVVTTLLSLAGNLFLLYGALDSGVTLTYTRASVDYVTLERDVIGVACNAALGGADRAEILEAVTVVSQPFEKEPLGWIAGNVQLDFEHDALVAVRYGDALDAYEDSLVESGGASDPTPVE